jgi:hypothetical protein
MRSSMGMLQLPLLLLAKIWGVIVRIASLGDPVYRLLKR